MNIAKPTNCFGKHCTTPTSSYSDFRLYIYAYLFAHNTEQKYQLTASASTFLITIFDNPLKGRIEEVGNLAMEREGGLVNLF